MDQNPSSKLRDELVFSHEPVLVDHRYSFAKTHPPCLNTQLEDLRYIKYEIVKGDQRYATTQEFQDPQDFDRHWKTQKKYDKNVFIHPIERLIRGNKHLMVFPVVMRDFNGCWVHIHVNGSDRSRVTDDQMGEIFKKIGYNMKYLSSDAESHRPHGDLRNGIGVTSDLRVFFYNLGDNGADPMLYRDDVIGLHGLLTKVEPKLQDSAINRFVNRWMNFLSDSCVHVKPNFRILQISAIDPPYKTPDHVRLIFNYPSSWTSEEEIRFLANMYRLGTDQPGSTTNLFQSAAFKTHLMKCGYYRWNDCFISGKNISALNEVYQNKTHIYVDKSRNLEITGIVLFAYNCVKHYGDNAQKYNQKNQYERGHKEYMLVLFEDVEILAELYKEFPHLTEHIYQAFYCAVAKGYKHPRVSIAQILTHRI